jgi:hypothetical protein
MIFLEKIQNNVSKIIVHDLSEVQEGVVVDYSIFLNNVNNCVEVTNVGLESFEVSYQNEIFLIAPITGKNDEECRIKFFPIEKGKPLEIFVTLPEKTKVLTNA